MPGKKWIFITGGVLSGLGKGLVSASIGKILQSKGYDVVPIKCDGYLNVDPGTMNPIEHGEVYVLDDGGEVDMDFGHYERFLGLNCLSKWNLTSGKVFRSVIDKERSGEYLGETVQMIPHVTDEIRDRFDNIIQDNDAEIGIVEIGGTVGDIENMLFLETVRQLMTELPEEDTCLIHVTLVPYLESIGEQKTKPTQHSVKELQGLGLNPDMIIGRSEYELAKNVREKIALFCNVPEKNVISNEDVDYVYEIPLSLMEENLDEKLFDELNIRRKKKDMKRWSKLVNNLKDPSGSVDIALCGKYTELEDSYASIREALMHCSAKLGLDVNLKLLETSELEEKNIIGSIDSFDGVIVPGGFGSRGVEGKIRAIEKCRKENIPLLGICYGMQLMVVEYARNMCGLAEANSTEIDEDTEHPVVDLLPGQLDVEEKGGTMRLGGQEVSIVQGTRASDIYNDKVVRKRFRHRYEVNPEYHDLLENNGLVFSGWSEKDENILQIVEIKEHQFFLGTQFHPEFSSDFENPSPIFLDFVKSTM